MLSPKRVWAVCWKSSCCVRWPWKHKGIERGPCPRWNECSCSPNQRATSGSLSMRGHRCWPCCVKRMHGTASPGTLPNCWQLQKGRKYSMSNSDWNASLYDQKHAFIFEYGKNLISDLNPQPGESILDLGCGTGHLAKAISEA